MSIRRTVQAGRGAPVVVAAVLTLTLAGCGIGDDEKPKAAQPSASASQGSAGTRSPVPNAPSTAVEEVIATSNGPESLVLEINSAVRDPGGFVTVNGKIKNNGSGKYVQTQIWRGTEKNASPNSIAGATLVDRAGKKRYYVLRDTEGRCLCTTSILSIDAGGSVSVTAQFPAPPSATTEVDFGLPTFATVAIKISG
ncbi:hypothetical protein DEJ50_20820 [Streptomyces venezuelae]|uniref:Secreted protein n=1 Tax=Streptomyces venezuelae TaxID=54571 RepID=A0A5P2D5S6_STRVZ|nr:hypothetical protein [Streptomyces venezuelae]QES49900.1 hypothetical protein DEJ50_20820 [Streptomyces venezuelae]